MVSSSRPNQRAPESPGWESRALFATDRSIFEISSSVGTGESYFSPIPICSIICSSDPTDCFWVFEDDCGIPLLTIYGKHTAAGKQLSFKKNHGEKEMRFQFKKN